MAIEMARQFTIPDAYVPGLTQIASVPDNAVREIVSALEGSPLPLDVKAATELISAKTPTVPSKDLRSLLLALLSLYSLRALQEWDTDELVANVRAAMKRSGKKELSLSPDIEERFVVRLKTLLGVRALMTGSKALFLQHEHEHTLCHARIFTDARPIYGEDPASPPSAAVITHMLKLAYHRGSQDAVEEIHIALDKTDLLKLKEMINRAESKAGSLKKVFDSQSIPVTE